MITAALHGVTVSPHGSGYREESDLARITCEIAERLEEMNDIKASAGTDLVRRLSTIARLNEGAFELTVAVLHGRTDALTESYSARGNAAGRKKQTIHYRVITEIEAIRAAFPQVAACLDAIRESVKHHEDPIERGRILREAVENGA